MQAECPDCGDSFIIRSVLVRDGQGFLCCKGCGAEYEISIEGSKAAEVEDDCHKTTKKTRKKCPKCSAALVDGQGACVTCGLGTIFFNSFKDERGEQASTLNGSWAYLLEHWEAEKAHSAFVQEAVAGGSYREAAIFLRKECEIAEHTLKAKEDLLQLRQMAAAQHLLQPTKVLPKEAEPFKGVLVMLFVLLFIGAGIGIYTMSNSKSWQNKSADFPDKTQGGGTNTPRHRRGMGAYR